MERSPHRLSHCGKMMWFTCKRAEAGDRSELVLCSASYGRQDNAFVKVAAAAGSAVVSRKTSAHVEVVTSDCAVDVRRRVMTPCVLVTERSEKRGSFKYRLFTLSGSDRLEPCVEFKLPYRMGEPVSVLRGPTVLWGHNDSLFYMSLQAGGVRQVPFQLSHCVIAELPLNKGQIFVLGLDSNTSQTIGYLVEDGQVFDGTGILPGPYVGIARCVSVLSAESVDGALRCAAVAATSNRQLVYLENATVRDTCELPYDKPERIQVVHAGRDGGAYVVSFSGGHICAVWKETFQVASCWSGVSSVHVDDFLGCGTDQMLLVFTSPSEVEEPLERFLITDLCGISYSRGLDAEAPPTAPPTPENFLLTVRALESRLQSGLSVLQELQQEARVKDRVLRQSLRTLVVSGSEAVPTDHRQEGLVALWEDDDDDDDGGGEPEDEASGDATRDAPAASWKPRVEKLWRRLAADRLVVGVTLTTDGSVPASSLSLSVLTETGRNSAPAVIQTQSQVVCLPSSSSVSTLTEPAAKRIRRCDDLNACRLAVTAAAALTPLLNPGRVRCRVLLHYGCRRDAAALASDPPAVLLCGHLDLDVRDDFRAQLLKTPQLQTDEVREDLLSLLAALDRWVLHLHSPDYSLGDIKGWIQKRVGCEEVAASPEYLLFNSPQPSAVMLLRWHHITPFQGELSVHSSQLQMLQFLDSLLAHLPASCCVRRVRGQRGRGAAGAFASALERELAALREGAAPALGEGEEAELAESAAPETGTAEGLQRCREAWRRHVETSERRSSPLVDVGRYRALIRSTSNVRLDGDLAALLDLQGTLLG